MAGNPQGRLAQYLSSQLDNWRKNRDPLVKKWNRNRSAFLREFFNDCWKNSETYDAKAREINIGIVRQKVLFAVAIICDLVLTNNRVRFNLLPLQSAFYAAMSTENPEEVREAVQQLTLLLEEQLDDCNADKEYAKAVFSAALYGEAYAKAVVYQKDKYGFQQPAENVWELNAQSRKAPGWEPRSVWQIVRDMEAPSLQHGKGYYDLDWVSPYWLWSKMGSPPEKGYIDDNLRQAAVLAKQQLDSSTGESTTSKTSATGVSSDSLPPNVRDLQHRQNVSEYAEYSGLVPLELVEEFEESINAENGIEPGLAEEAEPEEIIDEDTELNKSMTQVEVLATLCEGYIVRFARTTIQDRTVFRAIWPNDSDELQAFSIADNLEHVQLLMNGAFRSYQKNKKISANVMAAYKPEWVTTDPKEIQEGKLIQVSPECDDARKAFAPFQQNDVGQNLMEMLGLLDRVAEEEGMIPRLLQGLGTTGKDKETAFEISRRQEQAGKYIGLAVRELDNGIVEPMIEWFYRYDMEDPELTVSKANLQVKAAGFSGYQDRALRITKLQTVLGVFGAIPEGAAFGEMSLERLVRMILQSADIDTGLQKTTEEKQAEQQAAADKMAAENPPPPQELPPPPPPPPTPKDDADAAKKQSEAALATAKANQIRMESARSILAEEAAGKGNESRPA